MAQEPTTGPDTGNSGSQFVGIQGQIERITWHIVNAYNVVSDKGGTLSSSRKVADLANTISTIPDAATIINNAMNASY